MKIKRIYTGGQTGVDLAGLWAGYHLGIQTGGWAPSGYRTEDGPQEKLLRWFKLAECTSSDYAPRTRLNVEDSHLVLIISKVSDSPGTNLTKKFCDSLKRPYLLVKTDLDRCNEPFYAGQITDWIERQSAECETLMVAGNRESVAPGIFVHSLRILLSALDPKNF